MHPMASLLSAYGMGLADIRAVRTQAVEAELSRESRLEAAALIDALGVDCAAEVEAQGVPAAAVRVRASLFLKVKGTDTALEVRSGRRRRCGRRSRRRTGRGSASTRARRRW